MVPTFGYEEIVSFMNRNFVRALMLIPTAYLALSPATAKADAICVTCMAQAQVNPLNTAGVTTNQDTINSLTQTFAQLAATPPTTPPPPQGPMVINPPRSVSAQSPVAAKASAAPASAPKNHLVNVAPIFANSTATVQNGTLFQAPQGPVNWKVGDPLPWAQRPGQQEITPSDLLPRSFFATVSVSRA